jgi:tetratricopeptide (TPR) repeat protein
VQPETPPHPSIFIPFPRDTDFVERGTILEQVRQRCDVPCSRVALVGLGGIGKSQLAIEHAYRMRERSRETWVFWVHASNTARFEQSFRDIADCVKIAGRQDPHANIFKLAHDWLRDSKHPWLIVLDNVDDAQFLLDRQAEGREQIIGSGTTSRRLLDYLPYCESGSILVTSRNKEAALKLVEQCEVILVNPMDELQALLLFERKLGAQDENKNIRELISALEYMPLAIVQAAAYISHKAPRCSIAQYLEKFQRSNAEETSLLDYEAGYLRRDRDANNSIMITWQISFNHLQQTKPSAADLLSLMSLFDRQDIPETLLYSGELEETSLALEKRRSRLTWRLKALFRRDKSTLHNWQKHEEIGSSENAFEDDVTALRNLCLISVDVNRATFEMHRLVQLATRKWLAANDRLERWKESYIRRLHAAFPDPADFENWATCQALFAHVKSAAEQRPTDTSSLKEWAMLLTRAVKYAQTKGSLAEAEALAVRSTEALQVTLGRENEKTWASMGVLGLVYCDKGQLDQATRIQLHLVEVAKKKFGNDHQDTLTYMHHLAVTYYHRKQWADSEALIIPVIKMRKKKLGEDHPLTLESIIILAATHRYQGRLDEAEKLQSQVLEIRRRKLGEDHIKTLASMNNMAVTYIYQERLDEAEKLQLQVLEIRRRKLGEDHIETLSSMNNIAEMYRKQGRLDRAEEVHIQVLEMSKAKLGNVHPATLMSMYNLAQVWKDMGRDAEAICLLREYLQLYQGFDDDPEKVSDSAMLAEWEAEQATTERATIL